MYISIYTSTWHTITITIRSLLIIRKMFCFSKLTVLLINYNICKVEKKKKKESACNVEDQGLNPGSGRSPGEGNGNHSSSLAWRIRRSLAGLQQRVRQD